MLCFQKWSHSVVSDSLWPYGPWPTRLLCPWYFPGKNTGVGCHFLLQEIFQSQGLNLGLPNCRQTLYRLSHQGSPCFQKDMLFQKVPPRLHQHCGVCYHGLTVWSWWWSARTLRVRNREVPAAPFRSHPPLDYYAITRQSSLNFFVVQLLSCGLLFATLWTASRPVSCPSLSPRVCSNSCPLCRWCSPTISSSLAHFSFCLQSFPTSGSFPVNWLFPSSGPKYSSFSIISPFNEYSGLISFRMDWFDLFAVQGTL